MTPQAQTVLEAITSRRSVRGFTDDPVRDGDLRAILDAAARAPSGTNMQPWKVHVLTGPALVRFGTAICGAHDDPDAAQDWPYAYYPSPFPEPYLTRRREVGWGLYGLLGIARGDGEKMHRQHRRNFDFFGAPVGMIFTIDAALEIGSWLDYGMFLQNIMIAARGFGLATCPQAAFAGYHQPIRTQLGLAEDQTVICGMALGVEDVSEPANDLRTTRAPLADWVTFHDEA